MVTNQFMRLAQRIIFLNIQLNKIKNHPVGTVNFMVTNQQPILVIILFYLLMYKKNVRITIRIIFQIDFKD